MGPIDQFFSKMEAYGFTATVIQVPGFSHGIEGYDPLDFSNFISMLRGVVELRSGGLFFSVGIPVDVEQGIFARIGGRVDISGRLAVTLSGFTYLVSTGEVMKFSNLNDVYTAIENKEVASR